MECWNQIYLRTFRYLKSAERNLAASFTRCFSKNSNQFKTCNQTPFALSYSHNKLELKSKNANCLFSLLYIHLFPSVTFYLMLDTSKCRIAIIFVFLLNVFNKPCVIRSQKSRLFTHFADSNTNNCILDVPSKVKVSPKSGDKFKL